MKTIAKAILSAAAVAAMSAAHAQPYVGGSVGQTRHDAPGIGDRSDTGGKIYGGYSFTPNIAVEVGHAELGLSRFGDAGPTLRGNGQFVDAVGKFPITQGFSALGRVGVFSGKATVAGNSQRDTSAKYGLGVQYDFSKQLGLRGEWERYRLKPVTGKADADMYSVGLNYQF